jgi:hypothetical protein
MTLPPMCAVCWPKPPTDPYRRSIGRTALASDGGAVRMSGGRFVMIVSSAEQ